MSRKQKWIADGSLIDIENVESLLYINTGIKRFLHEDGWMFLSANKGMGKTLILKYKRQLIAKTSTSALIIPKNRPFLDSMAILPDLSKEKGSFISQTTIAPRIWILCIKLSVLTHTIVPLYPDEEAILKKLPNGYFNSIVNPENGLNPTLIFSQIIGKTPKEIITILEKFFNTIDIVFNRVRQEVHIFIDRVDQALIEVSQQAWITIQGSLLEAAWIIHASNSHIKVHASIRQEAYSNYHSPVLNNFSTSTMVLKYTEEELIEVLNRLAHYYENSSFNEFLGQAEFFNSVANQNENIFDFILRHTLNRPRDLVKICSQLAFQEIKGNTFIDVVLSTCNDEIVPNVFEEVKVFMDCLEDVEKRHRFFSLIQSNILSYEDVSRIFSVFNHMEPDTLGGIAFQDENLMHPFNELYKAGLLGIINEENIQKFRQPYDLQNFETFRLPKSKYYLIHPALRSYISNHRPGMVYNTFKCIIVGHNKQWDEFCNNKLVLIQTCLFKINDDSLTSLIQSYLKSNFAAIKASKAINDPAFQKISEKLDTIIETKDPNDPAKPVLGLQIFYALDEINKSGTPITHMA